MDWLHRAAVDLHSYARFAVLCGAEQCNSREPRLHHLYSAARWWLEAYVVVGKNRSCRLETRRKRMARCCGTRKSGKAGFVSPNQSLAKQQTTRCDIPNRSRDCSIKKTGLSWRIQDSLFYVTFLLTST